MTRSGLLHLSVVFDGSLHGLPEDLLSLFFGGNQVLFSLIRAQNLSHVEVDAVIPQEGRHPPFFVCRFTIFRELEARSAKDARHTCGNEQILGSERQQKKRRRRRKDHRERRRAVSHP